MVSTPNQMYGGALRRPRPIHTPPPGGEHVAHASIRQCRQTRRPRRCSDCPSPPRWRRLTARSVLRFAAGESGPSHPGGNDGRFPRHSLRHPSLPPLSRVHIMSRRKNHVVVPGLIETARTDFKRANPAGSRRGIKKRVAAGLASVGGDDKYPRGQRSTNTSVGRAESPAFGQGSCSLSRPASANVYLIGCVSLGSASRAERSHRSHSLAGCSGWTLMRRG